MSAQTQQSTDDAKGRAKRLPPVNKRVFISAAVGTLAITGVGIPLTTIGFAGFLSKDAVIESAYVGSTYAFVLLVVAACFTASMTFWLLDSFQINGFFFNHLGILLIFSLSFVFAFMQWRQTRDYPADRAALRWFLMTIYLGTGLFAGLIIIPAAIGLPFGIVPVGGSEVPTFLAYSAERRLDRRRANPQFGRGAIRGLAAPEAAGNSTTGMAMGALLTLGLPVSATAAIMLAAFRQYGLQPGPLLFDRSPDLVWALLASFFIAMIVLLAINLPFAQLWAKLLLIPKHYLYAGITLFCGLGIYATTGAVFDLLMLLGIGVLGFLMRRYGYPLAPLMIGMVLGPLAETSLRDALLSSVGDPAVLVSTPITWVIYGILAIVLAFSVRAAVVRRTRQDV